jgi:hypothetical protein
MWARLTRATIDPSLTDKAIDFSQNQAAPGAKGYGAKHGYWAVDRRTGKSASLVLFDSEQQMRDTAAGGAQLRNAAQELGATIDTVEEYEIVAEF